MSLFKENCRSQLLHDNQVYFYYDLENAARQAEADLHRLPYTIRILLESLIRQEDGLDITENHIEELLRWEPKNVSGEIPFKPARVILQDFTGVPAIVDLASMREAIVQLGGKAEQINPEVPVDLVIDHSVQVDAFGNEKALQKNSKFEFLRNKERYEFLKWAQQAFSNYRVVPPATGIVHQVNLEYLADVVKTGKENETDLLYPDSVFGTDSHTPMVNGLGVLGWGVGGIEAEACMLGEPSYFPTPEVIGVEFTGTLPPAATATDLALKVTQVLREKNVVGKFVEYFGEGIRSLTLADRATIANMSPENGATCGFFPVDEETLNYMRLTGRKEKQIELVAEYLKANHLFYDKEAHIQYSDVVEIDLSAIQSNLAGPKRPQDLIPLTEMKTSFEDAVTAPEGNQGFGLPKTELDKKAVLTLNQENYELATGSVVIAAITSCTNTSNPYVMLAAGLLAKNAVAKGLKVAPFVKTSLSPGSQVVTGYLEDSGLMPYLEALGFYLVGYGCTTCIGNSGPLEKAVEDTIKDNDLLVTSVLSGNRNFEGRIHPLTKANYLASPPLVVAYALAGNVNKNLEDEPLGLDKDGQPVYLKDIWPTAEEINEMIAKYVTPEIFQKYYAEVFDANQDWNAIETSEGSTYQWDEASTYIANPPFFENLSLTLDKKDELHQLRVLAKFGDSVTTDHISPAGSISPESPAGKYLLSHDVQPREFNSFGSRRGHHEVMMRGTFGNIRIRNQIAAGVEGGYTTYWPTGEIMSIYDAAMKNQEDGIGSVILAGADYGMGSSRDWAAKGSKLLGVKAVIAKSFERIHRSNLVMMGILPLQFIEGEDAQTLGLTGSETFTILLPEEPAIHEKVTVKATDADGNVKEFTTVARFDAQADIRYYQHQGILPMVIRKKLEEK